MIDFRYHLVSLISVFLALSVGIALGAGPLKEAIGDSLTGQVEQLRAEKEDLREDLDAASAALAGEDGFIDQSAAELLDGRLSGQRIAVVLLGDVPDDIAAGIDARLTQSGATVTGRIALTETWTDPEKRSYRQALAARLISYITPAPAGDSSTEQDLAAALVQALVGVDGADPTALGESSEVLLDLMTTGDEPLVSVDGKISGPADAIVVVAPIVEKSETATPEVVAAWLAVADQAQSRASGAVLVGPRGEGSAVDALMADEALAGRVSTVSDIALVAGQVKLPMALAAQLAGQIGHYGSSEGELVLPPTVTLPDASAEQGEG